MNKIDVVPTKPSAAKLRHPIDGLLGKGKPWTYDVFTMRRLTDGSIARGMPAPEAAPLAETAAAEPKAPVPGAAPGEASPTPPVR